jgi:hypothetical protein
MSDNTQPRRSGRPKGSKNRPPGFGEIMKQFERVYGRVEDMLTAEQKQYYREAFSGNAPFDPIMESELLLRLLGVYTTTIITSALEDGKSSEAVAQTVAQYRMGLKDIEEMKRKREDQKAKHGTDERLVDPTRKPELAIFETLRREHS